MRNWTEYRNGFGFPSSEFWLGNDKLSYLTNQNTYELQIDIENAEGASYHINYNVFRISDKRGEYMLTRLGKYSGNAGKGMLKLTFFIYVVVISMILLLDVTIISFLICGVFTGTK